MKALLILVSIALVFTIEIGDPPKLPMFVGRSYDLLKGNPLSNEIDPGFLSPVFAYTYNNGETTSDGRYLIPDGISHHKVSSCAFSTEIKTYRGSKSYQN